MWPSFLTITVSLPLGLSRLTYLSNSTGTEMAESRYRISPSSQYPMTLSRKLPPGSPTWSRLECCSPTKSRQRSLNFSNRKYSTTEPLAPQDPPWCLRLTTRRWRPSSHLICSTLGTLLSIAWTSSWNSKASHCSPRRPKHSSEQSILMKTEK